MFMPWAGRGPQPDAAELPLFVARRGMDLEAFAQVNPEKTEGPRRKRDPCMVDRSDGQRFIDSPVRGLLAVVDAFRVQRSSTSTL